MVISGILHVLKTGCRWRDVPPVYGPPTTISNSYNRWSRRRVLQRIFGKMAAAGPIPDGLPINSSQVKAHRLASASKRESEETIGGSRGGRTSKIPTIAADRPWQRTLFQLLARRAETCSGGRREGDSEAPMFQMPGLHVSSCIPAV
jgi:transposase